MIINYEQFGNTSYSFFPTFVETYIDDDTIALANKITKTKITYTNNDFWSWENTLKTDVKNVISYYGKKIVEKHYDNNIKNIVLGRSWINNHHKTEELTVHQHGNALFVCTYYIQCTDNTGDLIMVDPRGSMIINNYRSKTSVINTNSVRIKPKIGGLIFFPGYIYHYVEKNVSEIPRLSISTNFSIKENYDGFYIE